MGALMKAGVDSMESPTREDLLKIQQMLKAEQFKVEVGDDWTDDHETCCDFTISADGFEPIPFSLWWIDARVIGWAEACEDSPKVRAMFREYMAETIKWALEDVEDEE